LKEYHTRFKLPIKKLLIEYYRVKLNPSLEFAETYIEALGFRKCGTCKKRELELLNQFTGKCSNSIRFESRNNFIDLPF
jgi:hypothetical protein